MSDRTPQPTPEQQERTLAERLRSLRPALPCCEFGTGACTGGPRCWHDEPDIIPDSWAGDL